MINKSFEVQSENAFLQNIIERGIGPTKQLTQMDKCWSVSCDIYKING